MPKILFLRKKVKPSEYSWYLLQFSHYCDDGFEKRRLFKGSEKRERKSPPCTCTRRATNWRLTIIMIIYLASISREVKCETVTEIRYDVRCHSSNCAIKEIRWRWYKNYRKQIIFRGYSLKNKNIFFRWDFYCFGRRLWLLWSSPMKVRIIIFLKCNVTYTNLEKVDKSDL